MTTKMTNSIKTKADIRDRVSVIICSYKRADLFSRAVESVFRQTHKNVEVILVDDASPDNTREVAATIKDPRFKYIRHETNQKVAKATISGFNASTGNFLALLGDDDEWIGERKLEKQLAIFDNNPDDNMGLVGSWWEEFDGATSAHFEPVVPQTRSELEERMLTKGSLVNGSTALFSRQAWLDVGGFDPNQAKGTDSDLFRRIVLAGYQVGLLEEFAVKCYTQHERMTSNNNVAQLKRAISARVYNLEKLRDHYRRYPKAHGKYCEFVGTDYFKVFRFNKNPADLANGARYWAKALSLYSSNPLDLANRIFAIGKNAISRLTR